nr:hypothetical protein [Tanacetum cinerariifolium]
MALGYQNPFYLKQSQKKQQSLYDGKVLLEKHDPPVVHDSEETLQFAQESHEKMKHLNKEIKPANYTKINHLSGEAAKFVGDFKSFANETDASLAKHKALELEIKRLLKAVVSQDIIIIMQNESVVDTSDLQTEHEHTRNPLSQKLENENVDLEFQVLNYAKENAHVKTTYKNLFDSISVLRMFRINPFKTSRDEKHVPNTVRASDKKKPITVSQPLVITKKDVNSDLNGLSSTGVDNTKTRRPQPSRSKNNEAEVEEHHRNLLLSNNNKHISSVCNNIKIDSQDVISKVVCAMCKKCLISVNHGKCLRNYVNGKNSCGKKQKAMVIQIFLWCVDSGCSKHMTGNLKLLINFVWKFLGTVRFRNDHVAAILRFGDLQWGNTLITKVYFVEGLGHNLFSVGQFCDSNLEVVFRRNACFVRNIKGVDLLKGDRSTNLYTINLHEMASTSPICLMARASSTKNDLVSGLPKFKYHKEHLCPSCEQGKSKRASHPPKPVPNSRQRLHLLQMDLCGPMRIANIIGKRYVLVIVDDYSRCTWSPVIIIRTDNGTKFKNQVLKDYFDIVGISHQMSSFRSPQQNGVVERQNQTLVEAARTMLIFSCALLFLWAEAIATACFTQNRSIIHRLFNKTPYELINGKKLDISFLHVFGALCYPKNDREDIGKLGAKGDIGFFIGYSADSYAYIIYNRRTKKILETMNVSFDKLSAMAFEQRSSKPRLQSMTSGQISSGLDLTYAPSTITTQQPSEGELDLLFESMYDDYIGGQPSATARTVPPTQEPQVRQSLTASTTIADTAPTPTNSSSLTTNILITSQDVDELNSNAMVNGNTFVNPFANSSTSAAASSSSQNVDPSNMHMFYQPYPHEFQWTKDHPLKQVIGETS